MAISPLGSTLLGQDPSAPPHPLQVLANVLQQGALRNLAADYAKQAAPTAPSGPPLTGDSGGSGGVPASVRTNNPGAQWFGPIAQQYGATSKIGLPGGNNAAVFSDPVQGAAAQFALLNKGYVGMPLTSAVAKWSGGNSSPAYAAQIARETGLQPNAVITPELLRGETGRALAKSMARWEAGRDYPMTDAQWSAAQDLAFRGR